MIGNSYRMFLKRARATRLQAAEHGIGIVAKARYLFIQNFQSGLGVHPIYCSIDTGISLRELNDRGVKLTTHLHLAKKIKNEWCYVSSYTFMVRIRATLSVGCFLFPLRSKYSPQHPALEIPSIFQYKGQVSHPQEQQVKGMKYQ